MVYIFSAKSINAQRPETRICCSPDRRKQPYGKDNVEQKCWQPVIKHSDTSPSGICWLVGTENSLCTINQWKMFKINIFSKIKEKSVILTASQRARYIYRRDVWFNTVVRSKVKGACLCVYMCVCMCVCPVRTSCSSFSSSCWLLLAAPLRVVWVSAESFHSPVSPSAALVTVN